MAEPQIMSPKQYGLSVGYAPGQSIQGQELAKFKAEYARYRQEAMTAWKLDTSGGNHVRINPVTGMGMVITNAQGQPLPADAGSQDPYAAYMNPTGVSGADPAAADMTNSAAFQGVQPTAAPAGNAVMPVNVNPAAPAAAPSPTPAPVFRTEDDVISAAQAGQLSKAQAQQILVNQFGLDP